MILMNGGLYISIAKFLKKKKNEKVEYFEFKKLEMIGIVCIDAIQYI